MPKVCSSFISAAVAASFPVDIAHFWSLSLEEQFYLVWPLGIWLVRKRRALMVICGVAIVCVPLLRTWVFLHATPAELQAEGVIVSSYTRFDTLLIGAWCALWLRGPHPPSRSSLKRTAHVLIAVPLIVIVLGHLTVGQRWPLAMYHPMICTYELTLIGLVSAGLVLNCLLPETLIAQTLRQRPLLNLGRISYGFYVFHYLFIIQINKLSFRAERHHLGIVVALLAFCGTYVLARLSYQLLELPFLRLKDRFTARDHVTAPLKLTPL